MAIVLYTANSGVPSTAIPTFVSGSSVLGTIQFTNSDTQIFLTHGLNVPQRGHHGGIPVRVVRRHRSVRIRSRPCYRGPESHRCFASPELLGCEQGESDCWRRIRSAVPISSQLPDHSRAVNRRPRW